MHPAAASAARVVIAALMAVTAARAQVNIRPTPPPTVNAENESWYQRGEPIMFAGNLYYPAGAAVHFNAGEMVRSGSYQGVPLYSRTTIEPYSVVFVPIDGGRLRAYERPRTGELAGTSGSSVAVLPVGISSASTSPAAIQAPAPPMVVSRPIVFDDADRSSQQQVDFAAKSPAVPLQIGTSGRIESPQPPLPVRPGAANAMFVEFRNSRWFISGPPVAVNSRALTRVGEYHGLPVYAARNSSNATIYIPVGQGIDALARFSRRK
jgi:hypothetical protein